MSALIAAIMIILPASCLRVYDISDLLDDTSVGVDSVLDPESEYIAVFGDTQSYTQSKVYMDQFIYSMNWLTGQALAYNNIRCCLQVGDATDQNRKHQWRLYRDCMRAAMNHGIPTFTCTGNHDYDWDEKYQIANRTTTLINTYVHSLVPDSLILARYKEGHYENIIVKLPLRTANVNLLVLEYGARKEVVEWAKDWLTLYPETPTILMTHEMLNRDGSLATGNDVYAMHQFAGTGSTYSTPTYIVEKLINQHKNIVFTICGHNGFAGLNTEVARTPILLFNLQYEANCGDSQVLLLRIPPHADKSSVNISGFVYHTRMQMVVDTPISDFHTTIPFQF